MKIRGKFKSGPDVMPFQIIATFVRSGVEVLAFVNVLGFLVTVRPSEDSQKPGIGDKWLIQLVGDFSLDPDNRKAWVTGRLLRRADGRQAASSGNVSGLVRSHLAPPPTKRIVSTNHRAQERSRAACMKRGNRTRA
ncbi:MAG: hypothetical protein JWN50_551 [Parcubacteria group bacterium]|nr:hypothetical protein [Parcubacteria group bacterium]